MLIEHVRGDTLRRSFTLSGDWLGAQFSEIKFTISASFPALADTDTGVTQATKTGGGIVFDVDNDALGYITISAAAMNLLDTGSYNWDLQGTVTGSPQQVYTLARGKMRIVSDVTRVP